MSLRNTVPNPEHLKELEKWKIKIVAKKGEKTDNIYSFWKIEISPFQEGLTMSYASSNFEEKIILKKHSLSYLETFVLSSDFFQRSDLYIRWDQRCI